MTSNDTSTGRPTPRSFLRRLLIRALLLFLFTAGLNFFVNPFGSYATNFFEPIVLSTRRPKLKLYEQRLPAPEILLLGSSRSFTMEPAHVEMRTSRPAFNAAVHAASTGDYLNLARCLERRHAFPSLFIIGLGVEQVIVEARAVERHDPLATCASPGESSLRVDFRTYSGLLSLDEAQASLRALALELTGRPALRYSFAADGMISVSETRPLERAVDDGLASNWRPSTFDAEGLRPGSLDQLRMLLELCRAHGSEVIIYLPPYHPRATVRYMEESRFAVLRRQLLAQLASWAERYPVRFHDFTEVESFGGREHMFYDASHPTAEAFRLMLDAMLNDPR